MNDETFVDANTLIYASDQNSPFNPVAVKAMAHLKARGDRLCVSVQILIEFWSIATKSTQKGGLAYSPEKARIAVEGYLNAFELKLDTPDLFKTWLDLVTNSRLAGPKVHDARIAATMIVHGIRRILTFNGKDFDRFEGIEALEPASI